MEFYIRKLEVLRQWIGEFIDGISGKDILERRYGELEVEQLNIPKEKEKSEIYITDHAYDRAKERLGMSRGAFSKLAYKAYLDGVKHCNTAGNLKKWIDGTWFNYKNANNIRIYGEVFFLFNFKTLITVYQVPHNLRKSALKIQKT